MARFEISREFAAKFKHAFVEAQIPNKDLTLSRRG